MGAAMLAFTKMIFSLVLGVLRLFAPKDRRTHGLVRRRAVLGDIPF